MKQHEEQGDLAAFVGEPIGVAGAVALDEAVGCHFAQIVTQLGEGIRRGREGERRENRLMKLWRRPAGGASARRSNGKVSFDVTAAAAIIGLWRAIGPYRGGARGVRDRRRPPRG